MQRPAYSFISASLKNKILLSVRFRLWLTDEPFFPFVERHLVSDMVRNIALVSVFSSIFCEQFCWWTFLHSLKETLISNMLMFKTFKTSSGWLSQHFENLPFSWWIFLLVGSLQKNLARDLFAQLGKYWLNQLQTSCQKGSTKVIAPVSNFLPKNWNVDQVFKEANGQFEGLVSQTDVRALVGTKAAGGSCKGGGGRLSPGRVVGLSGGGT